ncbi:hypothetical protein [Snodgrassella alvi]|jgi:hypothetical protein|nr:hypothetical protein [Snodgrassella alvi]
MTAIAQATNQPLLSIGKLIVIVFYDHVHSLGFSSKVDSLPLQHQAI